MRFRHLVQAAFYFTMMVLIYSCKNGASDAEENYIKSRILEHNRNFSTHFIIDSLNRRTEIKAMRLLEGDADVEAEHFCDSVMEIKYKNRNTPYKISLDANLTYERFMNLCQQNKLDPIKTINELK